MHLVTETAQAILLAIKEALKDLKGVRACEAPLRV